MGSFAVLDPAARGRAGGVCGDAARRARGACDRAVRGRCRPLACRSERGGRAAEVRALPAATADGGIAVRAPGRTSRDQAAC
jgi:hypothetical protein